MPLTFKDMATEAPTSLEMWACSIVFRLLDTAFVSWSLCFPCATARFGSICSSSIRCQTQCRRLKEFQLRAVGSLEPMTLGKKFGAFWGERQKTSKNMFKKNWKTISLPPFLLCDSFTFRIFRQISFANA